MNPSVKKIIAREFLTFVVVLSISALVFLVPFVYNSVQGTRAIQKFEEANDISVAMNEDELPYVIILYTYVVKYNLYPDNTLGEFIYNIESDSSQKEIFKKISEIEGGLGFSLPEFQNRINSSYETGIEYFFKSSRKRNLRKEAERLNRSKFDFETDSSRLWIIIAVIFSLTYPLRLFYLAVRWSVNVLKS